MLRRSFWPSRICPKRSRDKTPTWKIRNSSNENRPTKNPLRQKAKPRNKNKKRLIWFGKPANRGASVAGRVRLHITPRIDRSIGHANFVVYVGAGGAAADSAIADHLSALHAGSSDGRKRRKVRVPRRDSESVVDYKHAAVAGVIFRADHHTVGSCMHGGAVIRS